MWISFHSHVRYEAFTCVTSLTHTCTAPFSYVWHDTFTCVTWHDSRGDSNPNLLSEIKVHCVLCVCVSSICT